MPKIVILGSTRFAPYDIIFVPQPDPHGLESAQKRCYAAIKEADIVLVYAPDGIGEHTRQDIDVARKLKKPIQLISIPRHFNEEEISNEDDPA